jgi:hypothetical protein
VAHGAFFFVRGAEALDLLELMTAVFAAVFVKGHGALVPLGLWMLFLF